MKKAIIVLPLLCIVCVAAMFLVVRTEEAILSSEFQSEKPELRPIDPSPIAVAFMDPDDTSTDAKNVIEAENWQFTNAEVLEGNVLEMVYQGVALSNSFPIHPGCYYFQIDQVTLDGFGGAIVGNTLFGLFHETRYAYGNSRWTTFPHFFRIHESEHQMRIGIRTMGENYAGGREAKVQFKNLKLLPAQALLNLAPKGQSLRDIYWGKNAVSRAEPTGIFLPLGRAERIEQDYKTKRSTYHFRIERGSADPWDCSDEPWGRNSFDRKLATIYPPLSLEYQPREKMIAESIHSGVENFDEMILKFELRPVSIGVDGEFSILPPIRLLSARMNGNFLNHFDRDREKYSEGMSWSKDGKTWKKFAPVIKLRDPDHIDIAYYPPPLPAKLFPCERLYLKFTPVEGVYDLSHLQWLCLEFELDTDQYCDYGRTSYFRIVPGETKESGMNINPLYTARNQAYFIYRNKTDKELLPEFAVRLGYSYSEQTEPKEVLFRASGNNMEQFDDITCRWEVLGKTDKIPPGEERICVFTLETSKLRASSHQQRGPFVSDVFSVEFDLGTYKMINEQMRLFPPRLAIE